ncbi:hypothetical protein L1049_008859 [Liquidambar formosana]|uniref:Pectinesterase n=1 Tax=Liquidambar formosana TaxID=63359 RepID=A0AAP0S473_LIQFO
MIAFQATLMAILLAVPTVISDDTVPIPAVKAQLNNWFQNNVKPYAARKGTLDAQLAAAETGAKVIRVRKDGSGNFKTVTDAIKSIPSGNTKRVIVFIGFGVYNEKVTIDRTRPFVTLYGAPGAMPTLSYGGTAKQYGTVNSASLIVESDYFTAANIIIQNTAPPPDGKREGAQAVALRISGDKAAFYGCKIKGFQDTICDDRGHHFFKDCYIEGTVDFIFGSGKSLYLNTELRVLPAPFGFTVITAQAREGASEDNGYSFVHCTITGTIKGTYLGRAWKTRPKVVFSYTNMGSIINPVGWSDYFHPERDDMVFFGEYKNTGAGAATAGRVKYTKLLNDAQAKPYIGLGYILGSKWLLPPPKV